MSIASEISRLQGAKSSIKTAIENKGVTVGSSLKLDDYAECIDEISGGGGGDGAIAGYVDYLLVGGGGAGCYQGGGGGEVQNGVCLPVPTASTIIIGHGGNIACTDLKDQNGGDSSIGGVVVAKGGQHGGYSSYGGACTIGQGLSTVGMSGSGCKGYFYKTCCGSHGGGGGASANGCNVSGCPTGGAGGAGKCGYGGGGGGYGSRYGGNGGEGGGGNGTGSCCQRSTDATNCGGGGGGTNGLGASGIAQISYPLDGSYGFTKASGGDCIYECNGKRYHIFTNNGAFTIGDDIKKCNYKICYLAVGGGSGGSICQYNYAYGAGGGGGGAVLEGNVVVGEQTQITIGAGGAFKGSGGDTKIVSEGQNKVSAWGGVVGNRSGGSSGNGYYTDGGNGAGAGGSDGTGIRGMGGGGGGGGCTGSAGKDGGGTGGSSGVAGTDATNYGGGGGGPGYGPTCGGKGCQGVVDICYPIDCSYGYCCALGGNCCYECDGMHVHRFTSNGTFTILYGLFLDKSSILMNTVGQTEQINVTLYGISGTVNWKSSNTSIATVDNNGLVTCIHPGECTITASCNGYEKTVSILATHVSSVTLNKNVSILLNAGDTEQLVATVNPSGAFDKTVIWTSSNENICTVDQTGLVTCVTPGNCIITVTTVEGGKTATCNVYGKMATVEYMAVGGGGGGGNTNYGGGGGGGGEVKTGNITICKAETITIGNGGGGATGGGNTTIGSLVTARGGCPGSGNKGGNSGSGCLGCMGYSQCNGGGGGGACGNAVCNPKESYYYVGGNGGKGYCSDISGTMDCYAGGGGGGEDYYNGASACRGCGCDGGGDGGYSRGGTACSGFKCGAGGGGYVMSGNPGSGAKGVVILRYPTSCGYNVTGGTKYTCGDYTIHCFTSNGTLTVS